MPKANRKEETPEVTEVKLESGVKREDKRNITGGLILLALGIIFLLGNFVNNLDFNRLWPLVLVAIGLGILFRSRD